LRRERTVPEIRQEDLNRLTEKLMKERGVDFREYKPTTLGRRITRRMDATKCADIDCYLKELDRRADEYGKLIDSILINVTEFFRDSEAWNVIRDEVMPRIMSEKRPGDQLRIWSAGCAAGQEPYSLAMMASEAIGSKLADYDVRIYATDIDDDALTTARRGEYESSAVESAPSDLLEKYFTRNVRWTVNRNVRKMVIFGRHNLVTDAPISHVDLIVCRNVLIYMGSELQNRVLSMFHYGLQPRSFLFLGRAEAILAPSRFFSPVSDRWRVFRKESTVGTGRGVLEQRTIGQAATESGAEYQSFAAFNEGVLKHVSAGIIAFDNDGIVRVVNSAAERFWRIRSSDMLGKSISELKAPPSLQEILPRVTHCRTQRTETVIGELDLSPEHDKPFYLSVALAPMHDLLGDSVGVALVAENITNQIHLRDELEAANERLQAANEELETTNEELQSTNEELETTNEELQSTNEELETTNEELQSTNEELSTTNDELSVRTDELNAIGVYYNSVLNVEQDPIVMVDDMDVVTMWNPASDQFYSITALEAVSRRFFDLPLPMRLGRLRNMLRKLHETGKHCVTPPMSYKTLTGGTEQFRIELQPLVDCTGAYKGAVLIAKAADFQPLEPAGT
jgi:two-component system, chemotaxis family, CheB/CheR fusion protein